MSKALIPVLALAAIGGTVFSVLEWNARASAEAAAAERDQRIAALEQSLRDALDAANKAKSDHSAELENTARLKKERDEAQEKAKNVATAAPVGEAPAADAKPQIDLRNMVGNFAKGLDDPEQRKMMKTMQERMVSGAYDKVFKQLGLNEADSKLVSELIGERNFLAMDRGRKLLTGKADEATIAEVRKDIETTKTEYDNKVKAVLGEQKYSEFSAYEQTVGDRRAMESLARDFERKGVPLEDSLKEKLTAIMTEERLKTPTNDIPDLGGGPGMQILMPDAEVKARQKQEEDYQQRVLARAGQAGLSPDQVNALQDSQKRQNERRAFGASMTRAFLFPAPAQK